MFKIGDRIRNRHTGREYTVCDVVDIYERRVFEISDDDFNLMRFNTDYLLHWEAVA